MPLPTFSWSPDWESSEDSEPKVKVTKFGDGYEARVAEGMNNNPASWKLGFSRDATTIAAIRAFLKARNAIEAFNWTNPFNEAGVYVCRKWSVVRKTGVLVLQAEFQQVFEAS
jgi:phage-related protein